MSCVTSYFKVPKTRVDAQAERDLCHSRAGYRCQVEGEGCTGRSEHAHHILLRKHGGSDLADNLLAVCHVDHARIHANPAEAYVNGWLRRLHPKPGDWFYEEAGE